MTDPDDRVAVGNLRIDPSLYQLVRDQIAPGTGQDADAVWASFDEIVADLAPKNRALLEARDALQKRLDGWHREHAGGAFDEGEYQAFLLEIGYLVPEGDDFEITTTAVDPEISSIAGPQLVVPVDNPRYALNATNARWGSLYDAFYGTDIIPETPGAEKGTSYNPGRGEKVVGRTAEFLDEVVADGRELERALELAHEYATQPPIPAQMIKRSVNKLVGALDEAIMHMDFDQWQLAALTEDAAEAREHIWEEGKIGRASCRERV